MFSPILDDAISRCRFAVGDSAAAELLPDATYSAVLTAQQDDEPATIRAVAAALAARYAIEPDSISSDGDRISWSERVAHWTRIATGAAGGAAAGVGKGLTLRRGPARDYTAGGGDAD